MTGKCVDSGTMQAFLDGELDFKRSETVAEHIALCDVCAMRLAVAEEETAMAFAALEGEFNTLVPTQRLWAKINDSIERENERKSFWTPIFAFFKQPSVAAFGGLLIVAGLFAVVVHRGTVSESNAVAVRQTEKIEKIPSSDPSAPEIRLPSTTFDSPETANFIRTSTPKNNRAGIRVVEARLVKDGGKKTFVKSNPEDFNRTPKRAGGENLAGEDSYIKTIATLTESVSNRKDEVLKPSARFAFERDLAVADDAIKTMKAEVKQNPNNEAAKQILRASYQNKIDLLNSVADKTELMASVK